MVSRNPKSDYGRNNNQLRYMHSETDSDHFNYKRLQNAIPNNKNLDLIPRPTKFGSSRSIRSLMNMNRSQDLTNSRQRNQNKLENLDYVFNINKS
jgi:hypothetical protein